MNITNESNSTPAFEPQASVMYIIEYYCSYIFITFGTLCNIIAVACLYNKSNTPKDKNNTVRYYLIALAGCDGVFIFWFALTVILLNRRTPVNLHWETGCNLVPFFILCSSELSSLLVMMITLNRLVAIFYPHKFKHLQSIRRIYCCIGTLILTVAIINWHTFGGLKPVDREQLDQAEFFEEQCRGRTPIIDDYNFKVHPFIDLTVYIIIPSVVLFVGNTALVIRLRKLYACSNQVNTAEVETLQEMQGSPGLVGRELVKDQSSRFSKHPQCNVTEPSLRKQSTSSDTRDKPDSSSERSQPGTPSDTGSQPRTSSERTRPCTLSQRSQPGTSSDARTQPGASSDARTQPGASCEYYSPYSANSEKIHAIPMPHHQAHRDTVPPRLGISTVTPMLDVSGSQLAISLGTSITISHSYPTMSTAPQSQLIKKGKHMTRICIILSISFLLLSSPMVALRIAILMDLVDVNSDTVVNLFPIFFLLMCCNHVINFWVYFVCWNEFRRRAVKLFKTFCCYQ